MFEIQKVPVTEIRIIGAFCLETFNGHGNFVRITQIRIIEVFVRIWFEIFKGPENFVRISKSSNYASSH